MQGLVRGVSRLSFHPAVLPRLSSIRAYSEVTSSVPKHRITPASLGPAPGSRTLVCARYLFKAVFLYTLTPEAISRAGSVEGQVQAWVEHLRAVPKDRKLALGMANQKLGLRVVRRL